jgi:hypothetical protein
MLIVFWAHEIVQKTMLIVFWAHEIVQKTMLIVFWAHEIVQKTMLIVFWAWFSKYTFQESMKYCVQFSPMFLEMYNFYLLNQF